MIESEVVNEKEKYLSSKIDETQLFITDLKSLAFATTPVSALSTSLIQQSNNNYQQKLIDATTRFKKIKTDYNRNYKLHQQKVIADAEFENFQFELDKAKN